MVPAAKIWRPRKGRKGRCHRLSGLITPSLDECVSSPPRWNVRFRSAGSSLVARRRAVHTAVKSIQIYGKGQTVYVTDASRAVGVVQALLSTESAGAYIDTVRTEYGKVAEAHRRSEADKQRLPLAKAARQCVQADWASYAPPRPCSRHKSISYL